MPHPPMQQAPPAARAASSAPVAAAPPPRRPATRAPAPNEALDPLAEDIAALKSPGTGMIIGCHAFGADVASVATSLPLARLLSRTGSTILVDLSGGQPEIEQAIGRFRPPGVSDMLAGAASFGDIIHRDRVTRLHAMPFGARTAEAIDPYRPQFEDMIAALTQTYDFVLLDAGTSADLLRTMAPNIGAIVMVATRDDSDPAVMRAFGQFDALLPGRVTIVVEEPAITTPRAANDPVGSAHTAA